MASIGPLALKLTTDSGPLEHGLAAAQAKMAQFASSGVIGNINSTITNLFSKMPGGQVVQSALAGIGNAAMGVLGQIPLIGPHLASLAGALGPVGLGAAAVTAAMAGLATSGFSTITALKDMGEVLGLSAEQVIGLSFAFQRIGLDQTKAEAALAKFAVKLGDLRSNPTGPLAAELNAVGINAARLADMPIDQALGVVADRFSTMENAADRANFAQSLFSRGWVEMRELLSQGSAGMQQAALRAQQLGISMSQVDMDSADQAAKAATRAWATATTIFTSLAQTVAIAAAPAVTAVSNFVESAIVMIQPALQIVRDLVGGLMSFVGGIAQVFVGALSIVQPVLGGLMQIVGAVWNVLKSIIGAVLAPFAAAFEAIAGAAGTTVSPLQILGTILGGVAQAINFVATAITAVGQFIGGLAGGALNVLITVLGVLWNILQFIVQVALIPFRIAWELISAVMGAILPSFSQLGSFLTMIGQGFMFVGGAIRSVAAFIADTLLAAVQALIGSFASLFGTLARIPVAGRAFTGVAASAQAAVAQIQSVRNSLNGVGQAGQDVAQQAAAAQQTALQAQLAADVGKMSDQWRDQAQFFGLSGRALEMARLQARGMTEEQMAQLRVQDQALTRLEEEARLREKINQTMQAARTPLQVFQNSFADLQAQVAGGLDTDVAARQAMGMIEQLEKAAGLGEVRAPAAITEGSAQAFSTINRAQQQASQQQDPVARLEQAMEANRRIQEQQREYLRRVAERLESGELFQQVNNL